MIGFFVFLFMVVFLGRGGDVLVCSSFCIFNNSVSEIFSLLLGSVLSYIGISSISE